MNRLSQKRIKTLDEVVQPLAIAFLEQATESLKEFGKPWNKYSVEITEAERDIIWQAGLYSQGRRWLKSKRKWVDVDSKKIVTWTIDGSNHLSGRAFDIALWNSHFNRYIWPDPRHSNPVKAKRALKLWKHFAEIGRSVGLHAGADWPKPKTDYPHFEYLQKILAEEHVCYSRR